MTVVVALLLGAASTVSAGAQTDPSKPLTEAQLKKALVTTADLPRGFTAEADKGGDGDDDMASTDCAPLNRLEKLDFAAEVDASFIKGNESLLTETLASGDEKKIRDAVTTFAEVPAKCPRFTAKVNGKPVTFKSSKLPFPALGDETHAVRLVLTTAGHEALPVDLVVVRRGATLIEVQNWVASGTPDSRITEKVVRTTLDKLKRV